jgi:hypothetical protein
VGLFLGLLFCSISLCVCFLFVMLFLFTTALKYNWKFGTVISPVLLFLVCFHKNFRNDLPISVKSDIRILMGIAMNL